MKCRFLITLCHILDFVQYVIPYPPLKNSSSKLSDRFQRNTTFKQQVILSFFVLVNEDLNSQIVNFIHERPSAFLMLFLTQLQSYCFLSAKKNN